MLLTVATLNATPTTTVDCICIYQSRWHSPRQVDSCCPIAGGDDGDVREEAHTPGKDLVEVIGLDGIPRFEGSVLQQAQPLHCCIQAPADGSHQTGQLLCCPISLHHNPKVLLKTRDSLLGGRPLPAAAAAAAAAAAGSAQAPQCCGGGGGCPD